jgi:hypothetical protein
VSPNTHKELELEIIMTMVLILDERVPNLSFRLEEDKQVVSYEYIGELLEFEEGAPDQVNVHENASEGCWGMITREDNQQRSSI